jgi:tRNA A37 methylthiotransferase MiaB
MKILLINPIAYPSNEEIIKNVIESGIVFFNLAIESGSKRMLRILKKSEKIVDCAENVVNTIKKYSKDIYITTFFLSGFPQETWKDFNLSKRLAKKLDIDWIFWNIYQPFKGCEMYDYCIEKGHIEKQDVKSIHYIESGLKNTKINLKKLSKKTYQFQLWYNFKKNRCVKTGNYEQAKRDIMHVLRITDYKHKEALNVIKKVERKLNDTWNS